MSAQAALNDHSSSLTPNQRKKLRKLRAKLGKRSEEVLPHPLPAVDIMLLTPSC
jgi:hypothetical protein